MKRITIVGLCLGAAFSVVLAGCGSSGSTTATTTSTASGASVNQAQIEKGIEESLSTSTVKVAGSTCPSNVQAQVGGTFTCTITLSNGGTGKATVTVVSSNHYTYVLAPSSVQISGKTADAAIEQALTAQGVSNATVECPQTIVVKVGTVFTCSVSGISGTASGTVTYGFTNAYGAISASTVKIT